MKFSLALRLSTICLVWAALILPSYAQSSEKVDLSGTWLTLSGDDIHRGAANVKENDWQKTSLPAAASSAGFVWYRRHFTIPADWANDPLLQQSHELILHIGNFKGALNVYLNGYHVQAFGTIPTDSKGTGYVAGTSKADGRLGITTEAKVGNQPVTLFNFGRDNVIAFQVYGDAAGDGFTGGDLEIENPGFELYYPYTRSLDGGDNGLFDTGHPIVVEVTLGNRTAAAVSDTLVVSALNDEGLVPVGFTPSNSPVPVAPSTEETITSTLKFADPGFYTINVAVGAGGKQLPNDSFVVGYNALEIFAVKSAKDDFTTFWKGVIKDASSAPDVSGASAAGGPNFNFTGLDGKPVTGWLTVPSDTTKKPPIIVEFPPYNSDFTGPDTSLVGSGVATLVVNVDQSFVGQGDGPISVGLGDPNTYAYRTIIGNAIKAIAGLPDSQVDTTRVGVAGLDQGAAIALTVASVEPSSVKAVFAADPLFALPLHSIKTATAGPYLAIKDYVASHADAAATLTYFDLTNLAPAIKVPVYLQQGLLDNVTTPYGAFATANDLTVRVSTDIDPNAGHATTSNLSKGFDWLSTNLQ